MQVKCCTNRADMSTICHLRCSMFGIPVSMSAAISGYRLTVERITRIANNLETFGTLPKFDQNSLLKVNVYILLSRDHDMLDVRHVSCMINSIS